MMKRRNVDCVKPRRPLKRNKISEGIYGSFVVYIKFALVWLLVLAADYLLDFRFEYLWPFWLLLRSVYDSFRYQGLAFCVLFLCMAVTADMVAIVFIPASWLFFAASTYVWVQFVWHTERGVCLPTIVLWALFIYIEAVVRLKEVKNVPFHMDLCRPFAAHCIGYPVVTLGFGLKSYVGYRLRQRKQREVARENEFYVQLLQEALPPDLQQLKNMSTAAAHVAAAVVKEYEDTETGETEINDPTSTSSAASGSRGSGGGGSSRSNAASGGDASGSGSWSKDCSTLPSLPFLTKLRKGTTQWWRSWLTKPDNIYKNGSSHTLNNCLVNSTVSNSSTSSSSSSCSSSSSSSSNSSCSSHRGVSAATAARSSVKGSDLGGGGGVGNTKEGGGGGGCSMASTPNGSAVHHHHHHHNTSNSSTAAAVTATTSSSPSLPPPSSPTPSFASTNKHSSKVANNALHAQLEYMQKQGVSARSVNNFDESAAEPDKTAKNSNNNTTATDVPEKNKNKSNANHHQSNGSAKVAVSHTNNLRGDTSTGGGGGGGNKKSKNKDTNRDTAVPPPRDEGLIIIRLESELKRARSELNGSRNSEQDLRNQVNTLVGNQKQCQQELAQLQQDNDTLQNKLHGLVTARQSDRLSLNGLERRVAEERRGRQAAEAQLQQLDRRNRKLEEQQQQQQQQLQRQHQTKSSSNSSGECSDLCRARRAELEAEVKRLRRDHRAQEDKTRAYERENITLRQYKESQNDNEVLMSALSAMQERNTTLESTLSAETRIKLDLLSALGDIKRQLQIAQGHLERKDKDIEELKAKFTEVLAVCPATSFSSTTLHTNSSAPQPYHYSSKLLLPQVSNSMESSLPPNLVTDLNLDSLVVSLGFPSSLPPHSPSVQQLSPLSFSSQQPPISPPTPGPISPPCNNSQPPNPPQHSNLDPNARIYTPKGVNGQGQNAQDN